MKNTIKLIVENNDKNLRVDVFISKKEKSLSRTRIKNLILKKKLKINGIIIEDPSKKVLDNQKIELIIPKPEKISLKPYNYKLNIVYEDNDLLVINKPAGIAIHPGPGNSDNTIVNALMNYCEKNLSNIGDELRPGIVHRIDKDTSGVIVVAKNNYCHSKLSNQFEKHTIKRKYEALIWGVLRPLNGKIENKIGRSNYNRQKMAVRINKGKKAITNYKTIKVFQNKNVPTISLVELILETGRTHQIRVQMAHKGNPVLGDKIYGGQKLKFKNIDLELEKKVKSFNRQALHAKYLEFFHPRNGNIVKYQATQPKDLKNLIDILKKLSKT